MALSIHRKFTYPAALVLSAGLGLSTVAGVPSPASAAPVIAGVPEPPDRSEKLKKALITEADVPDGYVKQDMEGFESILAEMITAQDPDASACDGLSALSGGDGTSAAATSDETDSDAAATSDDATTSTLSITGPSTPPAQGPAPAEPVKGSPPAVVGPPSAPAPVPGEPGATAGVVFLHEDTNAVAFEALAVVGEDAALATIDQVQEVLEDCPDIEIETVQVTSRPLAWNPPLGDESVTGSVRVQARFFGIDISADVKFAQVAYRDVALTVGLVGAADPKDREFKKITRAAVRRLVTTSGVTTAA
ncbi:hypothetical protein Aph02nite_91080 [Actinoplanes philippinensis]|uniref:PknH-like extracellular domain-containing protein n=1 Tax=Actinoplanes philippinensis TaxID=35752 RepID=A0A1I2MFF7_9ACTN|nr:hypothetical protein [Actinoplanes philippinensis]GIE83158.1 hypothetical protein Aph02nite_91080 [Actinoplanes philippinensis]SFF90235.1 hypothetical protein SAMN05421541_12920 [Actinoplanes philippinensis]